MILVLVTLAATACTTETQATPTVTDTESTTTPAQETSDPGACTSVHVEAAIAPGEWPNPEI